VTDPITMGSAFPTYPPPFPRECQVPPFFRGTPENYLVSALYESGPWWDERRGIWFDRNGRCDAPSKDLPILNSITPPAVPAIDSNTPTSFPFEHTIEQAFTDTWDALNAPDVYGVRILFNSESDTERTIVKFAPVLFDTEAEATDLLFKLTQPNGIRQLLGWTFLGWRLPDNGNWIPMGMRVCKLSEAPF
jgi:hypothetical protein